MLKLQKYILELGYKPYYFNPKTKKVDEVNPHPYSKGFSSMGNITVLYKLKGHKNILLGLFEKDKPPTLIHPRPKIEVFKDVYIEDKKHWLIQDQTHQDSMDMCFKNETTERIFEAIQDDTIVFKYDLRC